MEIPAQKIGEMPLEFYQKLNLNMGSNFCMNHVRGELVIYIVVCALLQHPINLIFSVCPVRCCKKYLSNKLFIVGENV